MYTLPEINVASNNSRKNESGVRAVVLKKRIPALRRPGFEPRLQDPTALSVRLRGG